MMNELELDQIYTDLCRALSAAGEEQATQALSRFALLAMLEISDPEKIRSMIRRATQQV